MRNWLVPGSNCWRLEQASRVAFLVDGAAYFETLRRALLKATRCIFIIGWDFDPAIKLRPGEQNEPTLGDMLREAVERQPDLDIKILVWALGPLYSSHSPELYVHHPWADHPRIHLRFDMRHPLRGSHHQKIVTIDDTVAFTGGIDLTNGRWDTSAHEVVSAHRKTPAGEAYEPVHDVQVAIAGNAAQALADVARQRWRRSGGDAVTPGQINLPLHDNWPPGLDADLTDCGLAVARTQSGWFQWRGRREATRLTLDMINAARKTLYIETQYLASRRVARALERRLQESDGPEILIIVTKSSRGIVEQFAMAQERDRIIHRLMATGGSRLRIMYRIKRDRDADGLEVLIHSKVIVADDLALRIGSSNLNNRSEGLDTECDVAVLARTAQHRQAIAAFRDRLLAEHLECTPATLADTLSCDKSWLAAVDCLAGQSGTLCAYTDRLQHPPLSGWIAGLFDPDHASRPFGWIARRLAARASTPPPGGLDDRKSRKAER